MIVVRGGMNTPPIVTPPLPTFLGPAVGKTGYKRNASDMTALRCDNVLKVFVSFMSTPCISSNMTSICSGLRASSANNPIRTIGIGSLESMYWLVSDASV
jgi:hypothetical protein